MKACVSSFNRIIDKSPERIRVRQQGVNVHVTHHIIGDLHKLHINLLMTQWRTQSRHRIIQKIRVFWLCDGEKQQERERERNKRRGEREKLREGGMSNTNNIPLLLLALPAALSHCLLLHCVTSLFTVTYIRHIWMWERIEKVFVSTVGSKACDIGSI